MEHKRFVVAVATDTSYAKSVNKSPVSVFDLEYVLDKNTISILPNNQLISNRYGQIYNIWSSYSSENKAYARRMRLSKVAKFDTDYEFEVTNPRRNYSKRPRSKQWLSSKRLTQIRNVV